MALNEVHAVALEAQLAAKSAAEVLGRLSAALGSSSQLMGPWLQERDALYARQRQLEQQLEASHQQAATEKEQLASQQVCVRQLENQVLELKAKLRVAYEDEQNTQAFLNNERERRQQHWQHLEEQRCLLHQQYQQLEQHKQQHQQSNPVSVPGRPAYKSDCRTGASCGDGHVDVEYGTCGQEVLGGGRHSNPATGKEPDGSPRNGSDSDLSLPPSQPRDGFIDHVPETLFVSWQEELFAGEAGAEKVAAAEAVMVAGVTARMMQAAPEGVVAADGPSDVSAAQVQVLVQSPEAAKPNQDDAPAKNAATATGALMQVVMVADATTVATAAEVAASASWASREQELTQGHVAQLEAVWAENKALQADLQGALTYRRISQRLRAENQKLQQQLQSLQQQLHNLQQQHSRDAHAPSTIPTTAEAATAAVTAQRPHQLEVTAARAAASAPASKTSPRVPGRDRDTWAAEVSDSGAIGQAMQDTTAAVAAVADATAGFTAVEVQAAEGGSEVAGALSVREAQLVSERKRYREKYREAKQACREARQLARHWQSAYWGLVAAQEGPEAVQHLRTGGGSRVCFGGGGGVMSVPPVAAVMAGFGDAGVCRALPQSEHPPEMSADEEGARYEGGGAATEGHHGDTGRRLGGDGSSERAQQCLGLIAAARGDVDRRLPLPAVCMEPGPDNEAADVVPPDPTGLLSGAASGCATLQDRGAAAAVPGSPTAIHGLIADVPPGDMEIGNIDGGSGDEDFDVTQAPSDAEQGGRGDVGGKLLNLARGQDDDGHSNDDRPYGRRDLGCDPATVQAPAGPEGVSRPETHQQLRHLPDPLPAQRRASRLRCEQEGGPEAYGGRNAVHDILHDYHNDGNQHQQVMEEEEQHQQDGEEEQQQQQQQQQQLLLAEHGQRRMEPAAEARGGRHCSPASHGARTRGHASSSADGTGGGSCGWLNKRRSRSWESLDADASGEAAAGTRSLGDCAAAAGGWVAATGGRGGGPGHAAGLTSRCSTEKGLVGRRYVQQQLPFKQKPKQVPTKQQARQPQQQPTETLTRRSRVQPSQSWQEVPDNGQCNPKGPQMPSRGAPGNNVYCEAGGAEGSDTECEMYGSGDMRHPPGPSSFKRKVLATTSTSGAAAAATAAAATGNSREVCGGAAELPLGPAGTPLTSSSDIPRRTALAIMQPPPPPPAMWQRPPGKPSVQAEHAAAGCRRTATASSTDLHAAAATAAASALGAGGGCSGGRGHEPGYKYSAVVRGRVEREALQSVECAGCKAFYEAVATWGAIVEPCCTHVRQQTSTAAAAAPGAAAGSNGGGGGGGLAAHAGARGETAPGQGQSGPRPLASALREVGGRHRFKFAPPATPEGFWDIGFGDTQN